jgi:hypothetical protein
VMTLLVTFERPTAGCSMLQRYYPDSRRIGEEFPRGPEHVVVQDTVAAGGALTSQSAVDRAGGAPDHMAFRRTAVAIIVVACGGKP